MENFDAISAMNAIDGAIADLASRTDRPQGYPFSQITLYSVSPEIRGFMPRLRHIPATNLPSMRKLDFKKAGKAFGKNVQQMKDNLDSVPPEYLITADRFPITDEPHRKTTGCRRYMIEVECDDMPHQWLAIQFKKAVKNHITETLGINIVPPIFGDKYPEENRPCIPRVWVKFFDGPEALYQALEEYGQQEFAETSIRLRLATRAELYYSEQDLSAYDMADVGGARIGVRTYNSINERDKS